MGVPLDTKFNFQLAPEGLKQGVVVQGDGYGASVPQDNYYAGHPLDHLGDQSLLGDFTVKGCIVGQCLTIETTDDPLTLNVADDHVGVGTTTPTTAGAILTVGGILGGDGTAGRAQGPGSVDYALTSDIPTYDTDTLQIVVDRVIQPPPT